MTPRLDDIRRDDDLLDALGDRRQVDGDEAIAMLSRWVEAIDHVPTAAATETTPAEAGRYARRGISFTGARRVASVSGIALAAISVSSVAAAVSGTSVPVFRELGTVSRGLVGNPGLPQSTTATGLDGDHSSSHDGPVGGFTDTTSTDTPGPTSGDRTTSAGDSTTKLPGSSVSSQWVWTGTQWVRTNTPQTRPTMPGSTSTQSLPQSTSTPGSTTSTHTPGTSTSTRTRPTKPETSSTTDPTSTTTGATTSGTTSGTRTKTHTSTRTSTTTSTATATDDVTTERLRPSNTTQTGNRPSDTGRGRTALSTTPTATPAGPTLPLPPGSTLTESPAPSADSSAPDATTAP